MEKWREQAARGEKIDPAECGIGYSGEKGSPHTFIRGRETYKRLFIRLRTPEETLTCSPVRDGRDFAQRAAIIEGWFDNVMRRGNFVLTFEAMQISDEEADILEANNSSNNYGDTEI